MATALYIEAYKDLMVDAQGRPCQVPGTLLGNDKVTVGASNANSSALPDGTTFVILTTDTACQISIGGTASATTSFLPANVPRAFWAKAGQTIGVIAQQ